MLRIGKKYSITPTAVTKNSIHIDSSSNKSEENKNEKENPEASQIDSDSANTSIADDNSAKKNTFLLTLINPNEIKKILYDYALGGDESKFRDLVSQPETAEFLLKCNAQIYCDKDQNTVLYHAARIQDPIRFLLLGFLIDSRADNLSLLNHLNEKQQSAFEYIFAARIPKPASAEKNYIVKKLISQIFLATNDTSDTQKFLKAISLRQAFDQDLVGLTKESYETFGVSFLLKKEFKESRETFELIRMLNIITNHAEFFSESEISIIASIIDIKAKNIKFLIDNPKIIKSVDISESKTLALYSICDFLNKEENFDQRDNNYFNIILSLAESFLNSGADPNYEVTVVQDGVRYKTPLIFYSSNFDYPRLIYALIEAGANCDRSIGNEFNVLSINAHNANPKNVKVILDLVPNLIKRPIGKTTLLHHVLRKADNHTDTKKYLEIAKLLMEMGLSCLIEDDKKITAKYLIDKLVSEGKISEDDPVKIISDSQIQQQEELEAQKREVDRRSDIEKLTKNLGRIIKNNFTFKNLKPAPQAAEISRLCTKINQEELVVFEEVNDFNLAFLAARYGKFDDLQSLIGKGFDSNYQDRNNFSLLAHSVNRPFEKDGEAKKITEFLVSQENLEFDLVKQALRNIAEANEQAHLTILINNPNIISKAADLGEKDFRKFTDDLYRAANVSLKGKVKDFFKEKIGEFSKAVLAKIQENLQPKESDSSYIYQEFKPLSKNEKKRIAKQIREEKEQKEQVLQFAKEIVEEAIIGAEKIIEEADLNRSNHGELTKLVKRELRGRTFSESERDISSIEDLPYKIQPIIKDLVNTPNFEVAVKGSYIYRNSKGEKVKRPNDLDLEIFAEGLSAKSNEEIKTIICQKFNLREESLLGKEPIINSSKNISLIFRDEVRGDEIKIFRSQKAFTVTFKSEEKLIDVTFYDPKIPPFPNLTWTTSIDARRIKVLNDENFSLEHTFVSHFLSSQKDSVEDRFVINSESQKLLLRLALLASKGLVTLDEIKGEIDGKRVNVFNLMKKEFGLDRKDEATAFDKIKSVLTDWVINHNLVAEKKEIFLETLLSLSTDLPINRELKAACQDLPSFVAISPKRSPSKAGVTNLKESQQQNSTTSGKI